MPINFTPNDPLALADAPMRVQQERPNRPAGRATFVTLTPPAPAGEFQPGTPEFLFWQCREAALAALDAWEDVDGTLGEWARATPNRQRLELLQNEGPDLNAFYDGQSVSFFEFTTGAKTTFSGASTDVVAHEVGHGLLDAIRPDLWDSSFTEPNAFHEAFGDCIAIVTALADRSQRQQVLPDLGAPNFVEATAEDLSDGVRRALGASHPAAAPRRALNAFQWQIPEVLPASGPPAVLSREIHSFGRVFSGCFYDLIRNLFGTLPGGDEAALLTAAQQATRLLIAGTRNAPEGPRFFRAVGRAMILEDEVNGGLNRMAIRNAFAGHGIALGSASMLAPTAALTGKAPAAAAAGARLGTSTRRDLLGLVGAPEGARLGVRAVKLGAEQAVEAAYTREVPLGDLDPRLRDVVAPAAETVLVGASGARAAVLGALPNSGNTTREVHAFVESLLRNDQIRFRDGSGGGARAAVSGSRGRRAAAASGATVPPTHTVRTQGGKQVLRRIRFVCGHYA